MEVSGVINVEVESVQYDDDEGYRVAFMQFFRIEVDVYADEYDEEQISIGLKTIYAATKDDPLFQALYLKAAGQFLSEDAELGLPVLLSYTFFPKFYTMLKHFLQGLVINVDEYDELMRMFDRK